ncbi:MAG: class I SAM-dependent methyltransferase, partial [Candidatus Dormibacteria bacterium]
ERARRAPVVEASGMTVATETDPVEALAGRLFLEGVGSLHLLTVYLGVRLGLYRALAERGSQTSSELARVRGLDPWYVREWLQAETIAGLVTADDEDLERARFTLSDGVRETLVEETHPAYLGGLPVAASAVGGVLPSLVEAFRTGAGVGYGAYGPEAITAQAALNRPAFVNSLSSEWLAAVPDVLARLRDEANPARVADVGCGVGWASIELAKAFQHIRVDGYDADEDSIGIARRNAADHGVLDRVTFEVVDAKTGGYAGAPYDLILFLECLHDMGRPVEALAGARAAVAEGGTVIVMDERVGDTLPEPGDPTETFFATASVLWCLPQSRVEPDCQAPGTVMRPATFASIAKRAGWSGVEVVPIDHPFWRFYRLVA